MNFYFLSGLGSTPCEEEENSAQTAWGPVTPNAVKEFLGLSLSLTKG